MTVWVGLAVVAAYIVVLVASVVLVERGYLRRSGGAR